MVRSLARASASVARFCKSRSTERHSARTAARPSFCAPGRAITTTSTPVGIKSDHVRKHSRHRRLTRLRSTAFPTFLETTSPMRDAASKGPDLDWAARRRMKCPVVTRRPSTLGADELGVPPQSPMAVERERHQSAGAAITAYKSSERGAAVPCGGDWREPCGRHGSTCGRESRACVPGERCGAGRCAS